MTTKILITARRPAEVERAFMAEFDTDIVGLNTDAGDASFQRQLDEYDFICPSIADRVSPMARDGAPYRTRGICNYGVGTDNIDVAGCRALGIAVTNTPGVVTADTADTAILLAMMCARRADEAQALLRSGGWSGWSPMQLLGTSLTGKTLGVIGMGRIGQATAMRAHFGFGMRILYHARAPKDLPFPAEHRPLDEVLAAADFVSLHVPGGPTTRHMIDARRLGLMKPHAILVNTGRGDLIDEAALIDALRERRIRAAGLDVYEREPHVPAALMALDNAVLLPHIGTATQETRTEMGLRVLANVRALAAGETPPDRVA